MTRAAVARLARLAALALPLALLAGLPGAAAQGGGSVNNVPPAIESFASPDGVRTGQWTSLWGVASDRNGEADLLELRLHRASPAPALWANHTVSAADLQATAAPANATAGWRVWNPAPNDGRLSWSFEWVPRAAGVHAWNLTASDEAIAASGLLNVSAKGAGNGGSPDPDNADSQGPPSTPPDDLDPHDDDPGDDPTDPGDPPVDPLAGVPRDLTPTLTVTREGGQVILAWDPVPGALGYQVWRSTSPWVLRAELEAGDARYEEPVPGKDAVYKVTFFTARTAAGGWAPDGEHAQDIPGWDGSAGVALEGDAGDRADGPFGLPVPAILGGIGIVVLLAALGAAALAARRRP